MEETEIRLARVEESTKSAHHRIDKLEAVQDEIRNLALSVNTLAGSVQRVCQDVSSIAGRVTNIESQPGKRWDQVVSVVLSALAGAAVGALISYITK